MSPQPLAADLRSADDRDLPSRTDVSGAALSDVDRRTGGAARADRPHPVHDAAAGDVPDRAGVPGARLVDQGGLPAERPAPAPPISGSPTGRTNAPTTSCATPTPCRSTRAELLSQGKFPYKSSWIETRRQRHAPQTSTTAARGALHGVSGADRALSVRVDGGGQDLHRADAKLVPLPVVAEVVMFFNIAAFGLALAWLATVWATAGLAGRRVWDAALVAASPRADLPDLHQLRRAGDGVRRCATAGVGAAKTGAGRGADRDGRGGQAVSAAAARPAADAGYAHRTAARGGQDGGRGGRDLAGGESAGAWCSSRGAGPSSSGSTPAAATTWTRCTTW